MADNSAPKTVWRRVPQACGTVRHFLWIDGREAPYFIDVSERIAHRSYGERIALWGSGMGDEVRRYDGSTYRIAGFLGGFRNLALAKHRAEQVALA